VRVKDGQAARGANTKHAHTLYPGDNTRITFIHSEHKCNDSTFFARKWAPVRKRVGSGDGCHALYNAQPIERMKQKREHSKVQIREIPVGSAV
jgi:hypothetical protein